MKNILIDKSIKLLPKEEMLEVKQNFKSLSIGIPKEFSLQEKRVALTPESVELLISCGHKVYVEKDAGKFSNFQNDEYIKYGAVITEKRDEIYSCDFVLKIEPPTEDEINFLSEKNVIISALQLNIHKKSFFDSINKKNITALSFEYLKDNEGKNSIVRSMSEIAGNTSVLIASECLSNINGGKGILLGGISGVISTNVVILGAGTVAEFAARSAAGLGANITIFDNSITKLKRLQNNLNIIDSKKIHISKDEAAEFYKVHQSKPFYNDLCSYLSSGPIVVMILEGENAVLSNRKIMGATDPKKAEKNTIRKLFGISIDKNSVHGSDSVENAKKEIEFFFES